MHAAHTPTAGPSRRRFRCVFFGITLIVLSSRRVVTCFSTTNTAKGATPERAVARSVTRFPAKRSPVAVPRSTSIELAEDATALPAIAQRVFESDARPVLLYDGVCNMCNGFVNLFLDVDKDEKFRFSALQSQTGRALLSMSGRSPDDISR